MQIVSVASKRDQIRKREVTQELLDEMELECKKKIEARNPDVAVLDLVPYYYTLDGKQQDEPPTPVQQATIVQAHFMANNICFAEDVYRNVFLFSKSINFVVQPFSNRIHTATICE